MDVMGGACRMCGREGKYTQDFVGVPNDSLRVNWREILKMELL